MILPLDQSSCISATVRTPHCTEFADLHALLDSTRVYTTLLLLLLLSFPVNRSRMFILTLRQLFIRHGFLRWDAVTRWRAVILLLVGLGLGRLAAATVVAA